MRNVRCLLVLFVGSLSAAWLVAPSFTRAQAGDAGASDAGDAGLTEAGAGEADVVDAGVVDSGVVDSDVVDAGVVDSGVGEAGVGDAGVGDEGAIAPPAAYEVRPPGEAEAAREAAREVEREAAVREAARDSDGDGIPDAVERATGTGPFRADTDRDGVSDGDEDTNLDGRVDPGESDPRVPGLFPGASPHLPEPMSFDLVRGLGARAGELETNVLVTMRPRRGGLAETTWAPEVEWAFADNLAIEIELPMVDREVHALKAAFQWTAPTPNQRFAHGVQVIGEYLLDEEATEVTGLYLFGGRVGSFAMFAMVGVRGVAAQGGHLEIVANPSAFVDVHEAVTLGIEGNAAIGVQGGRSGAALAQIHWQIAHRFRVQVGGGVEIEGGKVGAAVVTRWILE